jgi:sec-independent protein translocase protein TatA
VGYVTNPVHIVILLGIALLLFGGRRLPEIGRSLGTGMREFKDGLTGNSPPSEPQQELPPAEPTVAATTATPSEHETTV